MTKEDVADIFSAISKAIMDTYEASKRNAEPVKEVTPVTTEGTIEVASEEPKTEVGEIPVAEQPATTQAEVPVQQNNQQAAVDPNQRLAQLGVTAPITPQLNPIIPGGNSIPIVPSVNPLAVASVDPKYQLAMTQKNDQINRLQAELESLKSNQNNPPTNK